MPPPTPNGSFFKIFVFWPTHQIVFGHFEVFLLMNKRGSQPPYSLALEHHQKAKYLYSRLKASSHTKICCLSVAFWWRGRHLTRRRAAPSSLRRPLVPNATEKQKILVCLFAYNPIYFFLLTHETPPLKQHFKTIENSTFRKATSCSQF